MHVKNRDEISQGMYDEFTRKYKQEFNLSIKDSEILRILELSQLVTKDSFQNYRFKYPYIYYFFVAKYFADHLGNSKETINKIMSNLHVEKNAYVAVFLTHHSRDNFILDEILINAGEMFAKYPTANLTTDELSFFDDRLDCVVKALLPDASSTPESARKKELVEEEEQAVRRKEDETLSAASEDDLAVEIRKSIKTVEVMGAIIKNRAGSLGKSRLEEIFSNAANINLRMMSSFFDVIKHDAGQEEIESFIHERLKIIIEKQKEEAKQKDKKFREPDDDELKKLATSIFWNTNFFIIYAILGKIITALGSDKLLPIVNEVCDSKNDPAFKLIKHGICMQYDKNLQIENSTKLIKDKQ